MTLRIALIIGPSDRNIPVGFVEAGTVGRARLIVEKDTPAEISNGTALIGWAFHRQSSGVCEHLTAIEVDRLVSSEGAWAIKELWGNFLLFWADPEGRILLLRSPMTGPALFCFEDRDGRAIAFTDLSLARSLGFRLDQPDPERIDAWMRFPLLRGPDAELRGVRELLPGGGYRLGVGAAAGHKLVAMGPHAPLACSDRSRRSAQQGQSDGVGLEHALRAYPA